MMTTWRKELEKQFKTRGESWDDIVGTTLTDEALDREFNDGYGDEEGEPFTVWTGSRVYFPACYGGSEWIESVSRHPDGQPTKHIGGG